MPDKPIERSVLPIPTRQHVGLTTYDAKDPDTKFPPIVQLRPPAGAPNVLIILLIVSAFTGFLVATFVQAGNARRTYQEAGAQPNAEKANAS